MEAIPNVQIEWEWRGRTIRNMSLMTFGRQMYLIRESYSSTGIMMSLLPVGNGNNSQLDLITDDDNDNNDINDQQNQQSKESNENSLLYSSYSSNKHQRKLSGNHHHHHESIMIPEESTTTIVVNQHYHHHHHRVHRSNLNSIVEDPLSTSSPSPSSLSSKTSITSETTYKRTSTLYIMNALEKDSGRLVYF